MANCGTKHHIFDLINRHKVVSLVDKNRVQAGIKVINIDCALPLEAKLGQSDIARRADLLVFSQNQIIGSLIKSLLYLHLFDFLFPVSEFLFQLLVLWFAFEINFHLINRILLRLQFKEVCNLAVVVFCIRNCIELFLVLILKQYVTVCLKLKVPVHFAGYASAQLLE